MTDRYHREIDCVACRGTGRFHPETPAFRTMPGMQRDRQKRCSPMIPEDIKQHLPVFLAGKTFAARDDILWGIMALAGVQITARQVNGRVYSKEKFWITRLMNRDELWENTGLSRARGGSGNDHGDGYYQDCDSDRKSPKSRYSEVESMEGA